MVVGVEVVAICKSVVVGKEDAWKLGLKAWRKPGYKYKEAGLILAEVEYEKMPIEADSNDVVTSYVAKGPRRVLIP